MSFPILLPQSTSSLRHRGARLYAYELDFGPLPGGVRRHEPLSLVALVPQYPGGYACLYVHELRTCHLFVR
jgi:hypothetical protein